ncbi:hypothetical protein ACFWH1_28180 [Streptomyces sp. NPDC127037]|uniref:hypothetical protein n=1 Tax=Streptomyces sp. NPDC127037 TaxID=3347113 RepID=UPI0036612416
MKEAEHQWTRARSAGAPVYDPADPQSGRALVDWHLCELGLGEEQFLRVGEDGMWYCRYVCPAEIGVCRAYVLTEAAWPLGAELCVTVEWSPDAAMRRDPVHWKMRIPATARALESLGYVVEPARVGNSFRFHPYAEFLVYRLPRGVPPRKAPAETDWALSEPVPPNLLRRAWPWNEQSPENLVRDVLRKAGLDSSECWSASARVVVFPITQTVGRPRLTAVPG